MTPRRVRLGAEVQLVGETPDGIDLQGPVRLRPGQLVSITGIGAGSDRSACRQAWVLSWSISRLGSDGLMYRGHCQWEPAAGN